MQSVLVQRLISTFVALLLSAVALWWLLGDGTSQAIIDALKGARIWPLVLGAAIAIVIQAIRAWRFAILATGDLAWPSWTMTGIATKLVLFNFLLPFKLGELSFPLMMKRAYGTPYGQGVGILILCRFLDLGVVLAIILLTAAWLLDPAVQGWNPSLVSAFGIMALVLPPMVAGQITHLRSLAAGWPRVEKLAEQMSHGGEMTRLPGRRALTAALTLAIWILHATIAWLVARALDVDVGFPAMAMASASSNLAFALPISGVAGLGPPQAAWATMLHLAGHDWTPAITSALLCHGLLLLTLSAFGLAFWTRRLQHGDNVDKTERGDRHPLPSSGNR